MHIGPPGAGKSTSAALLAKHHGYVYYEGDCQLSCINPYLDPSIEEPSLAQSQQTPFKVCTVPKEFWLVIIFTFNFCMMYRDLVLKW